MSFQSKDLKILWGKAAGLCSMPDCRKKLVVDASDAVPSKAILLGENCHIVAEKSLGPRGESDLSSKDRNRYPNLILLCSIHHTTIDQDPKNWSIEKLHQIKADHEIWVETQLTIPDSQSEETKYYSHFVNTITQQLILSDWNWVSDNAFRCILVEEFVDGVYAVNEMVGRAIWAKDYEVLRSSIINLNERSYQYVEHFLTLAIHEAGDPAHFRENKHWKTVWREDYEKYAGNSKEWQNKSIGLLTNLVVALNEFAESVRESLNPHYLIYQGKFSLQDTVGMSTDGITPVYYIPEKYYEIGN